MPQLTINLTADQVARIGAAFANLQGPVPKGMLKEDFARERIIEYIKAVVREYETQEAAKVTIAAKSEQIKADFSSL